jgi:adenylate cyclase
MESTDSCRSLVEALLGKAELTGLDIARESGVEPDDLRRLWQALGFPPVTDDERRFTHADVDVLRAVRALVEVQHSDPSDVLQLTRVLGHAMARIADAQVTVIAERARGRRDPDAGSGQPVAELVSRIKSLAPILEAFLGYVWRRHVVAAVLQLAVAPSAVDRSLVVGFADMVGFTAMSRALDLHEIGKTVDRFEATASEHILERGGRVVKTIGDEVMFSVDDTVHAAEIALALVEAHARRDDLPDIRVGLASGPTLAWQGDLFGATVNLASRLVNFARPGSVVVSDEVGNELVSVPGLELRHLRPIRLKGVGRVRTWVLGRDH